jgi:hypothetical protein
MTNPLLFILITHKDGNLKKYGHHLTAIISQVEALKKRVCHMFLKTF